MRPHARGLILALQMALTHHVAGFAIQPLWKAANLWFALTARAATQDVFVDAFAVRVLAPSVRGYGNTFGSGLGTTILFAALMSATRPANAGLHFTILTSANALAIGVERRRYAPCHLKGERLAHFTTIRLGADVHEGGVTRPSSPLR